MAGIKASADTGELSLNKTAKTLQAVAGIDVYSDKKKGQIKDMVTILDEVQGKWKDLTEEQQRGFSEAIAGKQQSAVFNAIMSNYDQFKKLQGELSQDMHLGSMEAENARYVDSISGKLNKLKETWISIGTTMVSSDFTKGLLDGAIKVSEAIEKVIKSLDGIKMLTPVMTGFTLSFASMMKSISGGRGSNFGILTTLNKDLDKSKGLMNNIKQVGSNAFSTVGSAISSAGKYMASFLVQGLAIAGITVAVQLLAKAWDSAANGLKNAEKEIKNSIDEINDKLNSDKEKLTYLDNTSKRYDELIKKKQEYSKIPVDERTDEQIADLEELKGITSELAEMFPELVIGYDSEGSPIMLMADDMERLKGYTQEQIDLQNELLKIQREELAENARKRVQDGEFFGLAPGIEDKYKSEQALSKSLYDTLQMNERAYQQAVKEGNDGQIKKRKKLIDEQTKQMDVYYKNSLQQYNDYIKAEAEIQQSAFDQVASKKGYDKLSGESLSDFQGLFNGLNWNGMDENAYNSWVNSFDKIIDLANSGSPKVKQWSDSLQLANEKLAYNGDAEEYSKSLSSIAKVISEELNLDYETVFSGIEGIGKPLSLAEQELQNFLKTFGKTRYELANGDDIAEGLASQFKAINSVIDNVLNNENSYKKNGALKYNIVAEISNMDELPKQVTELTSQLQKGGVTKEESQIVVDLMYAVQEGNTKEAQEKIANLNKQLESMGLEEYKIDIKTLFDESGVDNAKSKVSELEKAFDSFRTDKSMKLMIDLVGEDKAKLYSEIIEKLPVNAEFTNKFIVENEEALSKMETYQEVVDYINSLPDEVQKTYGFNVNGAEETKQKVKETKTAVDELDDTDADVEIDADTSDAEEGIDKVNEKKKELEEPANLTVNNGELQGSVEEFSKLIEYSTKLKDGEYQINFKSDTADAIAQIDNLKLAINNLSNQFREIPSTTVSIETAQAAKNLSGLIVRLNETKSAVSGIGSKSVTIETAQAAKNLSGLLVRVREYTSSDIATKICNVETAQAAKNLSGLISKIDSYNGKKIPTKTVNVNVGNAISQLNTLINKLNALPTNKTVNVKVAQSGSVPKISPQSMPMATTQSNEVGLLSDTPQVIDEVNTPHVMSYSNPLDTFKYGLNHYIELENQLKKIASQLEIIDEKSKDAFGQEKIDYLKQQESLLIQQQKLQSDLAKEMEKQQQALKNMLSSKGIRFDSNGGISNYHDKLVAMNKEYEKLEEAAKKASDASSSYKGDDDSERDRLSNASKSASEKASKYKDDLDELKKAMDEYLSLTFDDIPKAKEEWEKLNNEIKDTNTSIKETADAMEELARNNRLFEHQNKVTELEYEYDKLADKLGIIDEKIKNAYGQDKLRLIEEQIYLMKQQQNIQNQLVDSLQQQAKIYRDDLSKYGFQFDGNGDVANLDETLNKFKGHEDLEKVQKLLEDYIKIQRDELPDATKEWEKLNSAIKDAYKEQLNITKKMEDEITQIYKKQVEERKKLIDEELNKRLDALEKEKNAYKEYRDEIDYQNDFQDQLDKINGLQEEYDKLSGDNSLGAKKKLEELLKQIEEEQKKLESLVQDKIDSDISDMFDKESDRLEEEADKEKEQLDKDFSDEKIQELVKAALNTGVFQEIDGTMRSLQDVMLEFVDEYGDGLSAVGDLIKNEMIANLEIAKDTMKELANIMKELDLNQYSYSMGRMSTSSIPDMSRYMSSNSNTQTVQFNSPLINIEGNVDQGIMSNLESMEGRIVDKVCKEIISKTNGR